jgi:hypothetical protein
MSRPRVPETPQPLEVLQERYGAAIEKLWDTRIIAADVANKRTPITPSGQPEHVFDSDDGLRLIISRDRYANPDPKKLLDRTGIHFSASMFGDLEKRVAAGNFNPMQFLALCVSRFQDISGDTGTVSYLGMSDGMIPHFIRWLD